MSVAKEPEEIASEICDEYCMWPEKYLEKYGPEDADEKMYCEKCDKCPLMRLL